MDIFAVGDRLKFRAVSKGKGFLGGMLKDTDFMEGPQSWSKHSEKENRVQLVVVVVPVVKLLKV